VAILGGPPRVVTVRLSVDGATQESVGHALDDTHSHVAVGSVPVCAAAGGHGCVDRPLAVVPGSLRQ